MTSTYPPTPELDRMMAVVDKSQSIGEFIEWMQVTKGAFFVRYHEHSSGCYTDSDKRICGFSDNSDPERINTPIEQLLAEYFHIDLVKAEQERRAVLSFVRGDKR